jgi:hypothetical protein
VDAPNPGTIATTHLRIRPFFHKMLALKEIVQHRGILDSENPSIPYCGGWSMEWYQYVLIVVVIGLICFVVWKRKNAG